MSFWKRVKDFFITIGGMFVVSLTSLIGTADWNDFVAWLWGSANDLAASHNIPGILVIIGGGLLAGVAKQIHNVYILNQRGMTATGAKSSLDAELL